MKALEIKRTTFKRMPHFFTDDNQYFALSLHATSSIDRAFVAYYQIFKIKYDGHTLNSQ